MESVFSFGSWSAVRYVESCCFVLCLLSSVLFSKLTFICTFLLC